MPNTTCVFCKKHPTMKGYYRCEYTGQILNGKCDSGYRCNHNCCKNYKTDLFNRFCKWLNEVDYKIWNMRMKRRDARKKRKSKRRNRK